MPFEALECFTVSLMVVAFVSYASVLATPTTIVTLQGLYGGLYNGVGKFGRASVHVCACKSVRVWFASAVVSVNVHVNYECWYERACEWECENGRT